MATVVAERVHSAVDRAWNADEERCFVEQLSPREVIHVAVDGEQGVVGLQILDRWSPILGSMAHVGQVGTFVLPAWRGCGIGHDLWDATSVFARSVGYGKLVIQVRGSNVAAQTFYRDLGFLVCGRLTRQVVIDGVEDDEVLMERFIRD